MGYSQQSSNNFSNTNGEQQEETALEMKRTVSHMLYSGHVPEEIAYSLQIKLPEVIRIKNTKGWDKIPENYLNEDEMEKYNEMIEYIRNTDLTEIMSIDKDAYKFIDSVTDRYANDHKNYKEKEDDYKILGEFNLIKYGIATNRKVIQKWLISRLLNEINRQKQILLFKELNLK